jgi:hypothetical protein
MMTEIPRSQSLVNPETPIALTLCLQEIAILSAFGVHQMHPILPGPNLISMKHWVQQ